MATTADQQLAGAVDYPITVHCAFCDRDLVIDLETTRTSKGVKRGPTTTTSGHAADCVQTH